ncbi:hypothetical protein FQA39_LY11899 [Lamprigera yunnana]|nr:hypothetical protein FQA39_LY11899 [Lamprigera yunnana]
MALELDLAAVGSSVHSVAWSSKMAVGVLPKIKQMVLFKIKVMFLCVSWCRISLPGLVLSAGSREAAFTYAISSAGVSYAVTTACAKGNISSCGCAPGPKPRDSTPSGWKWGGCSVDIAFGTRFARKFLDARELEGDERSLMNLHNNRAGRKVVKTSLITECKCHGVSGSCTMKTCWKTLPQFRQIGDTLMKKYYRARPVASSFATPGPRQTEAGNKKRRKLHLVLKKGKMPIKKAPKRADLVFLQMSPNYCEKDLTAGSLGTVGRICNRTSPVDSIPTSCVQLAKEQIIKYSDPKYNINDLKTGDCETMLLNQTIYYLNKSKSKWISVGLYYPFEFASVVKIFGRSKQYVIFKEEEWIQFHEQRENINKYFQTFDTMWKPRQIGSKTLTFEMIEEKKILKIEDMSGNEVYLGWESVSEVWSLESVLRYRLSYSSGSNFKYFYEDVIRAVAEMSGDVKINIYNIINRLSEKSDDVCCMLEVLLFMPEKALFDVQLERRIQEQGQKRVKKHLLKKMWMLYAQEHWTKCYDLKSAVERLYEELGALEFDADHEAIYGMERYYTVQQCEELRDKYKIGRKTFDTMWKPRQIGSKTLTFEMIEEKKILKIEDMSGNEVYLGWESVSEVWSLESVLRYRLSYSSGSNFKYFYEDVIRAVAEMSGDVKINIYNIINRLSEKSDDVCCMLEVLLFMPEKALFDVQLERRIQEQGQKRVKKHLLKKMWMLYAQEHWTKCYDLKSAVERLYEELGALEFDADHEAIYGMERYYTVQQCEELRDKYKIGRKVCRKFLQGRTCSQCLVKRISEIGLRHFLDTVNKYIKDCSDSSSSSDEEVFKAVEQNGEETTEEEEESKKSESESVTKLV